RKEIGWAIGSLVASGGLLADYVLRMVNRHDRPDGPDHHDPHGQAHTWEEISGGVELATAVYTCFDAVRRIRRAVNVWHELSAARGAAARSADTNANVEVVGNALDQEEHAIPIPRQ